MNILHIGMTAHFTENMTYQDNMMTEYNCRDGNTVTYITDTCSYSGWVLKDVGEEDKILENGLRLIRCKYDYIINRYITSKIVRVSKLAKLIEEVNPEVIMFHGLGTASLKYVIQYKLEHPQVTLYADSHASFGNSSKHVIARFVNKRFHGFYIKKALPYISKVFYVGLDSKEYLQEMYGIEERKLEWLPLGGTIVNLNEKEFSKRELVQTLDLPHDCIIFSHSGKLTKEKRTHELIEAFKQVKDDRFALLIFGSVPPDMEEILANDFNSDERIHFLGWKQGKEIENLLNATDVYCQPGTVSATFQNAMCSGCVPISYPWKAYDNYDQESIYWVKDAKDMKAVFESISANSEKLYERRNRAYNFAREYLDYKVISRRICN